MWGDADAICLVITSAISCGLHKLPSYVTTKLTAASEYKRRLFSAVYCSDKNHSSLNGIPPLLSKRYCDIEACLDLAPKTLYTPREELSEAISNLDIDGWNTAGDVFDTTILRAKVQLSMFREDVLELSLGTNTPVTLEIVKWVLSYSWPHLINSHSTLLQRSREVFAGFPAQLHYYVRDKVPKPSTGVILYEQAYLTLQSLQDVFLINRVAAARGVVNSQGLLDVALEMLDIAIMFWMKRDELMMFSATFDWIVSCALDLLTQVIESEIDNLADNILRHSMCWSNLYGTPQADDWAVQSATFTVRLHPKTYTLHWIPRLGTPYTWKLHLSEPSQRCSERCAWSRSQCSKSTNATRRAAYATRLRPIIDSRLRHARSGLA